MMELTKEVDGSRAQIFSPGEPIFDAMLRAHRHFDIPDEPGRLHLSGFHWTMDRADLYAMTFEAIRGECRLIPVDVATGIPEHKFQGVMINLRD